MGALQCISIAAVAQTSTGAGLGVGGFEQLLVKIALGGGGVTSIVIAGLIWMSRHSASLRVQAETSNTTLIEELRRQITTLQTTIDAMRAEHRAECERLRRERDAAQLEAARLEVTLERVRAGRETMP